MKVTVTNQGTIPAIFSSTSLGTHKPILSSGNYAEDFYPSFGSMTILEAGESKVFDLLPNKASNLPGTRTWTVIVDPQDIVSESDESNNEKAIAAMIVEGIADTSRS